VNKRHAMTSICISTMVDAPRQCLVVGASHLISLGAQVVRPPQIKPEHHLFLGFEDITLVTPETRPYAAKTQHMESLIDFGLEWDGVKPLMVHCHMGHSRSPAAAYIILCARHPGREDACAAAMRKYAPHTNPNMWMVELADEILNAEGRLMEGLRGWQEQFSGPRPLVRLPLMV